MSTTAPRRITNGKRPTTRPAGASGTQNTGGFIRSEELNREWTGQALYRTVDRMVRSDPVVRAALMMVMLPIAEATWTVEPAGSEPEDLAVAEFVRRACLEHLDWSKVVWQAIPARYGHAILEETYEAVEWSLSVPDEEGAQQDLPSSTYWVPAAFQPRLGRTIWRWMVDSTGRLESVIQQRLDPMTGRYSEVTIPTSQLVVITNEQEGDDYTGQSVLRSAYRSWYTKEKLELIDAIAKERGGAGVFVGYVPDKDWDSEADGMEENLRALRANEESFLVLRKADQTSDQGQEVEALDMKASGMVDCLPSLNYHVTQILWSVLAPWMNLGQGGEGARATAETQDDPFYLGLGYMAGAVASAFNRQMVPRLVGFNFQTDRYPRLVCGDIRPLDVNGLIASIAQLLTSGGIETDAELEAALRSMLGLPEKLIVEDEEEPEPVEDVTPDPETPDPPADEIDEPAPAEDATPASEVDEQSDPAARALSTAHETPPGRWRALTPAEQHVALDAIDATVEEQRQRYEALCRDEAVRIASHFASQLSGMPDDADLTRPTELQDTLAEQIRSVLQATAAFGRHSVRQELASQGGTTALATVPVPDDPAGLARWLTKRAKFSARVVVDRLRAAAQSLATQSFGEGRPPSERTLAALTSTAESGLRAEAVATVSQALSAGRRAETDAVAAEGVALKAQFSAILDTGTCGPCGSLDGDMYDVGSPEYEADYPPLADCEGGTRCRCLMVVISADEVRSSVPDQSPDETALPDQTAPSRDELVVEREEKIRENISESAHVFDASGREVVSKRGTETQVAFSDAEVARMKDGVLTHNHPIGPSGAQSNFSPADLDLAASADLAEIRAVSRDYTFRAERPSSGWREIDRDRFQEIFRGHTADAIREIRALPADEVRSRFGSVARATEEVEHLAMIRTAKDFGFRYVREAR